MAMKEAGTLHDHGRVRFCTDLIDRYRRITARLRDTDRVHE
jgi:hypothetical protein